MVLYSLKLCNLTLFTGDTSYGHRVFFTCFVAQLMTFDNGAIGRRKILHEGQLLCPMCLLPFGMIPSWASKCGAKKGLRLTIFWLLRRPLYPLIAIISKTVS